MLFCIVILVIVHPVKVLQCHVQQLVEVARDETTAWRRLLLLLREGHWHDVR